MTDPPRKNAPPPEASRQPPLPEPKIRPRRWPIFLIWIVPIAAAIIALLYYLDYRDAHAHEIVIRFSTAQGIKEGQTRVRHLGVEIGKVTSLELAPDHSAALVHVALHKAAADFARAGTVYWIERAELSAGSISGLTTVVSGPYIDATPGAGPFATTFDGLDRRPVTQGPGLRLVLHMTRLGHVGRDSALYFRGIQVGVVQDVELNANASGVDIHAFVNLRYAPLVRDSTRFWIESGIDVSGGIFSGLKLNVESLRAILGGAIAFATPDDTAPAALNDASFELFPEPKKDWLAWSSNIPLPPAPPQALDHEEPKPPALPHAPHAPR